MQLSVKRFCPLLQGGVTQNFDVIVIVIALHVRVSRMTRNYTTVDDDSNIAQLSESCPKRQVAVGGCDERCLKSMTLYSTTHHTNDDKSTFHMRIHRGPLKTCKFYFQDNFCKYGLILIILSPLQSVMNCRVSGYKISHISLNLLPHYLPKVKCSNFYTPLQQLFGSKVVQNPLSTVNIYKRW